MNTRLSDTAEFAGDESHVIERVSEIISGVIGIDRGAVTPESSIKNDLNGDSLHAVEILGSIEDEFGISIPDEDAESLDTVRKITHYVLSRRSHRAEEAA